MERIFEYQITAAEEGRKIGDFLREKGYSDICFGSSKRQKTAF